MAFCDTSGLCIVAIRSGREEWGTCVTLERSTVDPLTTFALSSDFLGQYFCLTFGLCLVFYCRKLLKEASEGRR